MLKEEKFFSYYIQDFNDSNMVKKPKFCFKDRASVINHVAYLLANTDAQFKRYSKKFDDKDVYEDDNVRAEIFEIKLQ